MDPRTIKTALWPLTEITLFADSVFSFVSYRIVLIVPNSFEIKSPGWITALSIEANATYTETLPKTQWTKSFEVLVRLQNGFVWQAMHRTILTNPTISAKFNNASD